MIDTTITADQRRLLRNTQLLAWIRTNFPRLRRVVAPLWRGRLDRWDYLVWKDVASRVFGRRTLHALSANGHVMRIRLAEWGDHTQLLGRPAERPIEQVIETLPRGSIVVDVGANIGRYALLAAEQVGARGRVIAVEPGALNFTLLSENAAMNGMHWVQPVQVALGAADGTAELVGGGDATTNTLRVDWLDHLEGTTGIERRPRQPVAVRSLTSLLLELNVPRVDLLKIDVEGAELEVLHGALPLLQSGSIKEVICELHEPAVRRADVERIFSLAGYGVSDLRDGELRAVRRTRPATERLRLAVVGCGAISESAHIPAVARVEQAQLVAIVDSDLAHARAAAARHGVDCAVSTLGELGGAVDAVVLATPPHVRAVLAREAFALGLHVLCEKPMANSSLECEGMLAAARDAGRVLAVGHNYRFFPNRAYARTLYASGELGRMVTVTVEQGDRFGGSSRTLYTLRRDMVPGGVLLNDGVHTLDMLFSWFGDPQRFDYRDDSLGGLESNVALALEYANGGIAAFRLSRTASLPNRIDMRFEHGALSFPIYDMAALRVETDGRSRDLVIHPTPWDFVEVAALQLRDFVDAIRHHRAPTVPGEDGLRTLRFIEECYQRAAARPRPHATPLPGVPW